MKKFFWVLSGIVILSTLTGSAFAINIQSQRVYLPGGRFLSLIESKPKQQDNLSLQFGANYALNPFEFGNSDSASRVEGIVDHLISFDFALGYSVTDRFAFGVNAPFHITNNIKSFSNLDEETVVSFGDVSLSAILNILDPEQSSAGFGLGIAPFLTFPSGVESNFVGDENFTGGLLLVGDMAWNANYINANMGFRFREEENFLNLEVAQEILYGLGYHHFLSESLGLDGFLESHGSIVVSGIESNSSPFEIMAGASKMYSEETPLTIKFAAGVGLGSGYGAPDLRTALQISYDYLLPRIIKKKERKTTVISTVETRLKELTIYYPTDGSKVDPFYDQKISEIANILKENPQMGPLYIVSHTDDVGTNEYNIQLSQERSEKAWQAILKYDIPEARVVWYGVGEDYPEYPNDDNVNRALNRRTIFTFNKPVYLDRQSGQDDSSQRNIENAPAATANDSYTEVLKQKQKNKTLKEGEYYEEESVVQKVPVTKQVEVKKKVKQKRKSRKSAGSEDALQEQNLDESTGDSSVGDDGFDEDL